MLAAHAPVTGRQVACWCAAGAAWERRAGGAARSAALDLPVQRKPLKINLLVGTRTKHEHKDDAVSPVVVPTLVQGQRIIEKIKGLRFQHAHGDRTAMLWAFFSGIMYAGLRPSECKP